MTWKKEYKKYYFEVGFHHGKKQYYAEVMQVDGKHGKWVGYRGHDFKCFSTKDEAFRYLGKYGYSNVGRFICMKN